MEFFLSFFSLISESPSILRRAIELTRRSQNVGNSSASALADEVRKLRSDLSRFRPETPRTARDAFTPRDTPREPREIPREPLTARPAPRDAFSPRDTPREPLTARQPRETVSARETVSGPADFRQCCCCCRGCGNFPTRAAASQTPVDLPEKYKSEIIRLRKENLRLVTILNRTNFQVSQSKANTLRMFRPSGFRP